MASKRSVRGSAIVLAFLAVGTVLGSATAAADELDDYRWDRRPLLLFAPTAGDPRLAETVSRIEASRCDFVSRDMVLGQLVSQGDSTIDGHVVNADEAQRLRDRFAITENAFGALLIGKDGGEKLRVDEVPDLRTIYAVIDGMPMRSAEMNADPSPC